MRPRLLWRLAAIVGLFDFSVLFLANGQDRPIDNTTAVTVGRKFAPTDASKVHVNDKTGKPFPRGLGDVMLAQADEGSGVKFAPTEPGDKHVNDKTGNPFCRGVGGLIGSVTSQQRHARYLAAAKFVAVPGVKVPDQYWIFPSKMSMWLNDKYGNCVTANKHLLVLAQEYGYKTLQYWHGATRMEH